MTAFIGNLNDKFRLRLAAQDLAENGHPVIAVIRLERRLMVDFTPTTLLAALVLDQIARLSLNDDPQHLPKIVSIRQLWEPPFLDSPAKTVKRAQGYVFLIRRASRNGLKSLTCEPS
jgi:hypothetical protein